MSFEATRLPAGLIVELMQNGENKASECSGDVKTKEEEKFPV